MNFVQVAGEQGKIHLINLDHVSRVVADGYSARVIFDLCFPGEGGESGGEVEVQLYGDEAREFMRAIRGESPTPRKGGRWQ